MKYNDIELLSSIGGLSNECSTLREFVEATLKPMSELFAAKSSVYISLTGEKSEPDIETFITTDVDSNFCELYQKHYHRFDPCQQLFEARLKSDTSAQVSTNEAITSEYEYINSNYYQDFLRPLKIHQDLIFSVGDDNEVHGLFGFHRGVDKEAFEQEDRLKAVLLTSQITSGFNLLSLKEKQNSNSSVFHELMERASVLGFMTISNDERVMVHSEGLNSNISFLKDEAPSNYWQQVKKRLPANATLFCDGVLSGWEGIKNSDYIEVSEDKQNAVPAMYISSDIDERNLKSKITILFLDGKAGPNISTNKLEKYGITPRQRDVLHYVGLGLTNAQIAFEMNISIKTLECHLTSIYQKTGCYNKAGLLNTLRP